MWSVQVSVSTTKGCQCPPLQPGVTEQGKNKIGKNCVPDGLSLVCSKSLLWLEQLETVLVNSSETVLVKAPPNTDQDRQNTIEIDVVNWNATHTWDMVNWHSAVRGLWSKG